MTPDIRLLWQVLHLHGRKKWLKRSRGGLFEGSRLRKEPKT